MADIAIFRINYKSDFILTLNSDAGWLTPFCIKFWTGAPSQAYFAGYDGTTYTNCAPVEGEPTKLLVQFDDHHLPIGDLKFQIGYHFTVADFPTSVEDEVINQSAVIIDNDGEQQQVMLDFNGETAPEIAFALPAYANEAQRIANEEQRIANEQTRIANEEARIAAETIRQQNEEQRIEHENARVDEFAQLKRDSEQATSDANTAANLANEKAQLAADKAALAQAAATLANEKAQLASDKAALANAAAQLANEKAALAQQKAEYAQQQGGYAKDQGDYAKNKGDYAKEQGDTALADHQRAEADHAAAADDHQTAAADHITATADHSTAASDHSRAEADHTTASSDHSRAESDHTTAASDHTRAESDHNTAASDHETAASDHTRAESDHAAVEVYVDSLGVFDLSKHNAVDGVLATYADLSAALTALNALDSKYKYGGMSFKFVQSSDNKYVQFRLIADSWSVDTADWSFCGNNVLVENPEWIYVLLDANDRILAGLKSDGSVEWSIGIPTPVKKYIDDAIAEIKNGTEGTDIDGLNKIIDFLSDFSASDTLKDLLDTKVDKEEGKSLIEAEYAEGVHYVENPEFVEAHVDAEDKILYGVKQNGDFYFAAGVPSQVQEELDNVAEVAANKVDKEEGKSLITSDYASSQSAIDNPEYLQAIIDNDSKILEGIKQNGTKFINTDLKVGGNAKILGNMEVSGVSYNVIENSEYIAAWVDAKSKVIFGFKTDGKTYVGDADFLNDIKDNQEAIDRIEEFINSTGVDNIKSSIANLISVTDTLSEDVELLKSHSSGGVSFSTNFILSDSIQGNDLFIQNNTLIVDGGSTEAVQGYSSTSFVNIMGIIYLEYDNLHAIDIQNGYYPIFLYDKDFNYIDHADVVVNQSKNTAGSLDLSQYPTAAYAIFSNDSDTNLPSIQMFTRTEKIKNERNNILVGAYYFAGWSEIDFPNIHHTEAMLNDYNGRKPIWGWLDHVSVKGDGWLITPSITLNNGSSIITLTHSCLFRSEGQCKLFVREVSHDWIDKTPTFPSPTKTTMNNTTVDITEFAGKTIQIGFKLKTSLSEQSAIWTINGIEIISNGSSVYNKDYTDHSNFDCTITDTDVWKPATWTRGYGLLNGYVGTTVNQKDTSVIDKQIVLAKQHGIDYFMLEWFYYDDQSTFNEQASYNEDNHIAVHAFMNSCQKLGFKFAVMITNHSPFRIVGLQNWKDAIAYLSREYFKDPSYLVVDNKPVIYIFDKTEYRAAGPDAINDYFIELGWSGAYVLFTNYNTVPNTGQVIERDITDLYNAAKQWNINGYKGDHQYNFVANATCGWDSRPWAVRPSGYARPTDWFVPDISKWRNLFDWLYRFAKVYNNGKFKALLICAWNEYGEGSYLAPTEDDKRGKMLLTIGDIINKYKY